MTRLRVNGSTYDVQADPETPLLWVLRDELDMTGTKFGCGVAACGACTVLLDGAAARSCLMPLEAAAEAEITTIEAIHTTKAGAAVQEAWRERDVVQCGYCQSGQIVQATALLSENQSPGDADIDVAMGGNVCRCATYVRIRAAIHDAARKLEV